MASKIDRRQFLVSTGITAGLAAVATGPVHAKRARVRITALKVEYLHQPLGLEIQRPRLSWQLESDERDVRQTAYRIRVASDEDKARAGTGDLWDSGEIHSSSSFGIFYQGTQLTSRQRCWWRVEVWEQLGEESAVSEVSWWEMGLLDRKDWTAQWLAVEDAVAKADRETGLHWVWGDATRGKSTRGFRFKFTVPAVVDCGELYAVANDYPLWTQITRIWIDGVAVAGRGAWIDDENQVSMTESSTVRLALQSMSAGDHLVAVEVRTAELPSVMEASPLEYGLALFSRLNLSTGKTLRLGSNLKGKTHLVQDDKWVQPGFDDTAWEDMRNVPSITHQPWPAQPALHLRRAFQIKQPIVKARLYATALGAYEARLNGCRIGDALLSPDRSEYTQRLLYQLYDITQMVHVGSNVLALTVADGWYASFDDRYAWGPPPRRVLAQLELTLEDGSRQVIATGPGWRAKESAIRVSQIKVGEISDARLEPVGWDSNLLGADTGWWDAQITDAPPCRLVAQTSPPIRVTQILRPARLNEPKPGVYVFDFAQNFAGWCRLHVRGAAGTQVALKFAELLTDSGEIDQPYMNVGKPKEDIFILRGDAAGETLEPRFTYRGFRYVQIHGLPTAPTLQDLEGVVIHTDVQMTGQLRASEPLIEQIWRCIVWTRRSNLVGVPTDCASREQRAYLEAIGNCWDDAAFNMDMSALTSRLMENIVDKQDPNGSFSIVAPGPRANNAFDHIPGGGPGICASGIVLPWTAWRRYGDLAIIENNWESMTHYLKFIHDNNPDYIGKNGHAVEWGDWLALYDIEVDSALPRTPNDLMGTAYWAHCATLLAQMGRAIGRTNEAERLSSLSHRVRRAFNEAFVKPDGTVGNGSQTSYILALRFELLPADIKQKAAARLAEDVRSRGVSLTTGVLGTSQIFDALTDAGFPDLAYGLLLRTEYPSFGHMVRRGATTIWETWSGEQAFRTSSGQVKTYKMSRNHSELASISGFLFRRVAGIDASAPGFKTIVIRPALDARVKGGGGDYDSVMGRISTDWAQKPDGTFMLDVTIPSNASARIHLPAQPSARIEESLRSIVRRRDVKLVDRSHQEAIVAVGSGFYRFVVANE